MKIELTLLISIVSALVGMITGINSVKRNAEKDIARSSRETATIISEIGYVKAGIDDIKNKQEKRDERHYSLAARVSKIEATMSAHIM